MTYYASTSFKTPRLTIVAALAGFDHQFSFEGMSVGIQLPHRDEAASVHDPSTPLAVISWKTETEEPTTFDVRSVRVLVTPNEQSRLARLVSSAHGNDEKPIAAGFGGTEHFNAELSLLGNVALRAVEHWLRVVQWRTGRWYVGRPRRPSRRVTTVSLFEESTHRRVVSGPIHLEGSVAEPMPESEWLDVQDALTRGAEPPLSYQLFFDGQEHLSIGDHRRAVIELAMACEVLLKTLVEERTPDTLFEPGKKYLLRANATVLLKQFAKSLISDAWVKQNGGLIKSVERLFATRNRVVHEHHLAPITSSECIEFKSAVERLLATGSPR